MCNSVSNRHVRDKSPADGPGAVPLGPGLVPATRLFLPADLAMALLRLSYREPRRLRP